MTNIVRIAQGHLQGKECFTYSGKKYYSFEGIPYAKPPVGKLRFRDPEEPENWTGIRDATKPGEKCAQMDPYAKKSLTGSEDCLYLNVYTPSLPDEIIQKLPVIFFVHGGRFIVGYGDYYKPDYFIENDVILVTINYRLHILGFLCLHTPEVPGNAAMKDTIFALKWVKSNIVNFNGDQNNVTAFGESAGSGLVTSYVTSKMAAGLVDKIIAESGICLSDLMLIEDDPIEKARNIASMLGQDLTDTKDLYNFLLTAPVEELLFATSIAELSRPPHVINAYFLPVIEKKFEGIVRFFDEYPLVTMLKNQHKDMPILMGLNSHEGALFVRKDSEGNIEYLTDVQRFIPLYLSMKHNSPISKKLGMRLQEFYFQNKEINDHTKNEYVDLLSDTYFNRDVIIFAEIFSKFSDKLYFYNFAYSGNMHTRIMKSIGMDGQGSSHGDIMQYQFYKQNKAEKCDERDKKIVSFLSETWCNFVKNGKPTWSSQRTDWPAYTRADRLCLNIDVEQSVIQCPSWNRVKFWIDNMGERSKL